MLVEIDKRSNLAVKDFRHEYLSKNRPVLLREMAWTCPAMTGWSLDFFQNRYGESDVQVTTGAHQVETIKLSHYITRLRNNEPNPGYLRDWTISKVDPKLLDDVPRLQHFSTDILQHNSLTRDLLKWIYIGPRGSTTALHVDVWQSHSWMLLISGKKRWTMFSPAEIEKIGIRQDLKPKAVEHAIQLASHQIDRLEFDLLPGDILFVPTGWWHQVENLTTSIAVTFNFIDAYSLSGAYKIADRNMQMFDELVVGEISKLQDMSTENGEMASLRAAQQEALSEALKTRSRELAHRAHILSVEAERLRCG